MKRKKFLETCTVAAIGIPLSFGLLHSCSGIYYATVKEEGQKITVAKKEFIPERKIKSTKREFVLIENKKYGFPICLYKITEDHYVASLLKCTHRGCELNVGGGIYTCPCHGSQFTREGTVLQGPAEQKLTTYTIKTDDENIYILLP